MTHPLLKFNDTNKRTTLRSFAYDMRYDMAQQYGYAQVVQYSLNGTRVQGGTCRLKQRNQY